MQAPSIDTPLADKIAYHRTQHTSEGINVSHHVGAQIIFSGLPVQRCGQRKVGRAAPTPPTDARPATMAA
jgi:hypothetical protein